MVFLIFFRKIQFGYDLGIGTYHLLTIELLTEFIEISNLSLSVIG